MGALLNLALAFAAGGGYIADYALAREAVPWNNPGEGMSA